MCIGLDIVVSGPQCRLAVIAKGLSQVGLFLQPPQLGTTTLPYENPQYLYLPGFMQVEVPPSSSHHQAYSDGMSKHLRDEEALDLSDGYPDFDLILEELPRHDYLKEAVVDIRIKTKLQYGPALGLAGKLGIDHLVGPITKIARRFNTPQNICAANPAI